MTAISPDGTERGRLEMAKAVSECDVEEIARLIAAGVSPNVLTRPSMQWTALMEAAYDGCAPVVEFLCQQGADLELRDEEGKSALDIVDFELDPYGLANILVAHGAIRNPRLKTRQDGLNEFYDALDAIQSRYHDDRMFVYEISIGTGGSVLSADRRQTWSVISRRNVHGFPPVGIKEFDRYEDALAFYRMVVPGTPRISLGEKAPSPVPSWEEHQAWLAAQDLLRDEVGSDALGVVKSS